MASDAPIYEKKYDDDSDDSWGDGDTDLPPLEDMSEEIRAARKMKEIMQPAGSTPDDSLYESVVTDAGKAAPAVQVIETGSRVRIDGLVKAPQYNGRVGKVKEIVEEEDRAVVVLEKGVGAGKELRVKRGNLTLEKGLKGG
eukprot:CAMPEP_0174932148 /NCGR_PEP_ID=MMETSP1355-20121228/35548_1 /TAXON_ID=464990 /ORGANISM="Hemiselmis tepida, Strain CCMP443" /LENGTH=140 /DNA_ID=CAMNT_0016178549 /DNA_START=16 /DNA_END=434 /DNA_ORIENTATION=+